LKQLIKSDVCAPQEGKTISSDKDSPFEAIKSVGTMAREEVHAILRRERAAVTIQALVRGAKYRKTTVRSLSSKAPPKRNQEQGNL
jgi:hypothetical protein